MAAVTAKKGDRQRSEADSASELSSLIQRLSEALQPKGRIAKVRARREGGLAVAERVLESGPHNPQSRLSLLISYGSLGDALAMQGNLPKALNAYLESLALAVSLAGADPGNGQWQHNLSVSYDRAAGQLKKLGSRGEARAFYERALAIRESFLGADHPDVAASLDNLADELTDERDLAGARRLFERSLAIYEKVLGPEHPHAVPALNNLAILLSGEGDLASARRLFERALAIRERVLGPEHPDTATIRKNLANLLMQAGDLAGARRSFERVLPVLERLLGPEHPSAFLVLHQLAAVLNKLGDHVGALRLFERAMNIVSKKIESEGAHAVGSLFDDSGPKQYNRLDHLEDLLAFQRVAIRKIEFYSDIEYSPTLPYTGIDLPSGGGVGTRSNESGKDELLNRYLAAEGVAEHARPSVAIMLREMIAKTKAELAARIKPPVPELNATQIAAVKKHAEKRPWKKRREFGYGWKTNVFEFVRAEYGKWIPGLIQSHLKADSELYRFFTTQVSLGGLPDWLDVPSERAARIRNITDPLERTERKAWREHERKRSRQRRATLT